MYNKWIKTEKTRRHFSRMHTAYSQQSASYVNKCEHIQGDRAGALAQVGGWAPVQG